LNSPPLALSRLHQTECDGLQSAEQQAPNLFLHHRLGKNYVKQFQLGTCLRFQRVNVGGREQKTNYRASGDMLCRKEMDPFTSEDKGKFEKIRASVLPPIHTDCAGKSGNANRE